MIKVKTNMDVLVVTSIKILTTGIESIIEVRVLQMCLAYLLDDDFDKLVKNKINQRESVYFQLTD